MKKTFVTSLSVLILASGVVAPISNASEKVNPTSANELQKNIDYDEIARQAAKENGANVEVEKEGKATLTLKAAKALLQKNKDKINGAIKSAINKLPLSSEQKKKWAAAITIDVFLKYLNSVTNFTGSIEDAAQDWLKSIGVPGWLAQVIVKTISFFLV